MLDPITIRYSFRPVARSLATGRVADLFGLPAQEPPHTIAENLSLDARGVGNGDARVDERPLRFILHADAKRRLCLLCGSGDRKQRTREHENNRRKPSRNRCHVDLLLFEQIGLDRWIDLDLFECPLFDRLVVD